MGSGQSKARGMVAPKIGRPRPPRVFGARKIPGQRTAPPPSPGPATPVARTLIGPGPGWGPLPPTSRKTK